MNDWIKGWAERWNIPPAALYELSVMMRPPSEHVGPETTEANTQQRIRIEAGKNKLAMWRNNNGACQDATGRMIRYGLGNDSAKINKIFKSSDLIGIGPGGRLVACEVKHPGWTKPTNEREQAQQSFLTLVNTLGGIGFFANSVEDYRRVVLNET